MATSTRTTRSTSACGASDRHARRDRRGGPGLDDPADGLTITKKITLVGGTITGNAAGAILAIRADVTLRGVTLVRKGGIGDVVTIDRARLVATDVIVRGGRAPKSGKLGGGLRIGGTARATLTGCTFDRNYDGLTVEGHAAAEIERTVGKEPIATWAIDARSAHWAIANNTRKLDALSPVAIPPGLFYGVAVF